MGYIGAHGVASLHKYKYSGVDHSLLAKYVLQPFWSRFVTLFPLWMPPNMITLMGFMFLLLSALLGYIYSPRLDSAPPRWVHFAHGLLLFLYQTFDAVDGKQARRTNSSSPLGELFDHGCDALACTFESLAFGSTAMCGRSTFWFWLISAIPFYGATWEHYFTNTLILPVINGPTEGLMLIYVCHFFTAAVGAEWWIQQFGKSMPFLSWLPIIGGSIFSFFWLAKVSFFLFSISNFNPHLLEQQRLNALVFVKYNLQLEIRQKHRVAKGDTYDPICLSDVEFDDEWITEKEDPCLGEDNSWMDVQECFDIDEGAPNKKRKRGPRNLNAIANANKKGKGKAVETQDEVEETGDDSVSDNEEEENEELVKLNDNDDSNSDSDSDINLEE